MSHKSWLKGLMQRVAVSSSSRRIQGKRRAFSPVVVEPLEDRTVPAPLTWTGAAGSTWNNPGNWTGGGVPSAVNNVLNFTAGASVTNYTSTNDIAGLSGMTINITDADATKDFSIGGINVGVTAVTHNKTDNQASSTALDLAMTGAGATVTNTAGVLKIDNLLNVFDPASTVNVPTGATLNVIVAPSSSMGSATYNLTGGTLGLGQIPSFNNAFNVGQNTTANDVSAGGVPSTSLGTDVQQYPMMPDISRSVPGGDGRFQTNTHTWGNNHTYFYSGEIFFPDDGSGSGTIAFGEQNDDSTLVTIDGEVVISNTT
jgi:hypothetical protein